MSFISENILSLVTFAPLLGALAILLIPKNKPELCGKIALGATLLTFALSLHLIWHFEEGSGFQYEILKNWTQSLGIHYAMGLDGFSLWLVILTTFLMPIAVWFSLDSIKAKQKTYYFFLLFLQTGMIGALVALDIFLFYLFWEAMLIPMYFLIGIYGHGRKIYAAYKFFIFTLLGSVLMLLAMIYLYFQAGETFLLSKWMQLEILPQMQIILFAIFGLSFAIKVPMFPLHTWLPDAHTEAPTAGSVILAGVLLKMGTYGFIRFAMPLFPQGLDFFRPGLIILAIIGILYGALVAMVQKDMKRLVAYSSIAHLGFVMLGLMSANEQAMTGAVYQMLNHGISTGALFLMVGMLYDRTHTRLIADYGGIAKLYPWLTVYFIIVTLSSIAMPGTNGFVGEFLILSGSFRQVPIGVIMATLGVILSAVYMLWMVERVFFGPLRNQELKKHSDLTWREVACLAPLILMIFWMGLKPDFFLNKIEPAVMSLIEQTAPRAIVLK